MGSTRTLFNFVHASSAFQESVSDFAERNRARVVETHLLQCLLSRGGISDKILRSVLLASLILAVSNLRVAWGRFSFTRVRSRECLLHFLHNERPEALEFSLPQRPQQFRLPKEVVDCSARVLSIAFVRKIRLCVLRWLTKVDRA